MIRSVLFSRILSSAGLVCLAMSLLLMPAGVRIVRAHDEVKEPISADPSPQTGRAHEFGGGPPTAAVVGADAAEQAPRRGSVGTTEGQTGVVVLNTRGYNYGPPSAKPEPASIGQEPKTR
jgi:hypothetical protein